MGGHRVIARPARLRICPDERDRRWRGNTTAQNAGENNLSRGCPPSATERKTSATWRGLSNVPSYSASLPSTRSSIYIYNEYRGYTSIDRVLEAVAARCPDDAVFIAAIQKHCADERKHYMMFRRWSGAARNDAAEGLIAPAATSTMLLSRSSSARRSTISTQSGDASDALFERLLGRDHADRNAWHAGKSTSC